MRGAVLFSDAVQFLVQKDFDLFVEVGPHPVLTPALGDITAEKKAAVVSTLSREDGL